MSEQITVGSIYKGGKVISKHVQGTTARGVNGKANLPVNKRFIGREFVIVQFSDKSTQRYYI